MYPTHLPPIRRWAQGRRGAGTDHPSGPPRGAPATTSSAHRSPDRLPYGPRAQQPPQPRAGGAQTRGGHRGVPAPEQTWVGGWVHWDSASQDGCGQRWVTLTGAAGGHGAAAGVGGTWGARAASGQHPQHRQPHQPPATGTKMATERHTLKNKTKQNNNLYIRTPNIFICIMLLLYLLI